MVLSVAFLNGAECLLADLDSALSALNGNHRKWRLFEKSQKLFESVRKLSLTFLLILLDGYKGWIILSFLIVILVGLPIWWVTVAVYRAKMPFDLIQEAVNNVFPMQIFQFISGRSIGISRGICLESRKRF